MSEQKLKNMIKGVIFDMEGVLVDTQKYICEACTRMFANNNFQVPENEIFQAIVSGRTNYIEELIRKHNLPLSAEKAKYETYSIFREIVQDKVFSLPGAIKFIEKCKEQGLKIGIRTQGDKIQTLINFREIGLPMDVFDATIDSSEQIKDCEELLYDMYNQTARLLGLNPDECLFIEKSSTGIKAGKRTGARCLAISKDPSTEEFKDADWKCSSLLKTPPEALNW